MRISSILYLIILIIYFIIIHIASEIYKRIRIKERKDLIKIFSFLIFYIKYSIKLKA